VQIDLNPLKPEESFLVDLNWISEIKEKTCLPLWRVLQSEWGHKKFASGKPLSEAYGCKMHHVGQSECGDFVNGSIKEQGRKKRTSWDTDTLKEQTREVILWGLTGTLDANKIANPRGHATATIFIHFTLMSSDMEGIHWASA